jgi:GDP-4-dehydro-6-deoxy-D-mannose reductase
VRILITGSRGFVGRHLVGTLIGRGHEVIETDPGLGTGPYAFDVTDHEAMRAVLAHERPDAVAHLAARAFIPDSFEDPEGTFAVNLGGTLSLLDALRDAALPPRVLIASSAEVYGIQPSAAEAVTEEAPTQPRNPYAASKVAAEAAALAYARTYGVQAVVTRAFNHIGAGQDQRFAIADFAAQLARIAAGGEPLLVVGNLEASRDFLDVRDVCAAYADLLEGGGEAGEIYNVCSGTATTMREMLRQLIQIARVPVEVREDPNRLRPADIPVSVGSAAKLHAATGWTPRIPLAAALRAVYEDACSRITVVR